MFWISADFCCPERRHFCQFLSTSTCNKNIAAFILVQKVLPSNIHAASWSWTPTTRAGGTDGERGGREGWWGWQRRPALLSHQLLRPRGYQLQAGLTPLLLPPLLWVQYKWELTTPRWLQNHLQMLLLAKLGECEKRRLGTC